METSLIGSLASTAADVVLVALLGDLWVCNAVNIAAITSSWAGGEIFPMVTTARALVEASEPSAKLMLLFAFPLVLARMRRFYEARLVGGYRAPEDRNVVSTAVVALVWIGNCFLTLFLLGVGLGLLAPEGGSSQEMVAVVPSDVAGFCFSFLSCLLLVPDMVPRLF